MDSVFGLKVFSGFGVGFGLSSGFVVGIAGFMYSALSLTVSLDSV